jgi:hypothetical protein
VPKPADDTPTRRYIMQAVMTLIFAATIALAAAVSSRQRRANRVELSADAVTARDVTVRLPQGWRAQPADAKDPGLVVKAIEEFDADDDDADADAARTVTVRVEHLPAPRSPLNHLLANVEAPLRGPRGGRTIEEWLTPIPMAGYSGVMATSERGSRRRRGGTVRKDVVAAVVLPSLRAVTVHLEGVGEADAHDRAVVKGIAGAITLAGEPALGKRGEVVTLPDGIRFTAPRRFAKVDDTDSTRTDRRLWLASTAAADTVDELEGNWLTIETVGCLCPDFDASDPKQVDRAKATLATLLLVRDGSWHGANVTSIGNKTWRADAANADEGIATARAFLMTHPSGRALLAIVRRGVGDADFDAPWRDLAATVQFLPAGDVASLEDLGASEAARLRRTGFDKLLPDRDLSWWLWTERDAYIGWSNLDFRPPAKPGASAPGPDLIGKHQHHLRLPGAGDDRIAHLTHDFTYRDAAANYTSTITREQIHGDQRAKFTQQTALANNRLSMSFQPPDAAAATQIWNDDPAPPQFVPGALLPLVLGQLARDPMVLVTDTFPGRDGIGPAQPLTLIIRPGDPPASATRAAVTTSTTSTTAAAAAAAAALRCVTVQVNGTGSVSRWYFRHTGELERVDWGAGLQQLASDESAVRNTFPKGDALAP